ncbi:MAG: 4'-phosphopantetheinyl transferase superfamily protein [Ginsengibacter sp.]
MPLFYQHTINDTTKLAVWHITEREDFFLENVQLQKKIHHPHKRLQHLAGRYLLQLLQPGFPFHLIEIAESNKPLLLNEAFHFSISHCGDFAAAIVCENESAGIDVELITPKIELIKNKFLNETEQKFLPTVNAQLLTLFWSCKEAVYKWYGRAGVDFKSHIVIKNILINNHKGIVECQFVKNQQKDLVIHFQFFENLCLAWVIG